MGWLRLHCSWHSGGPKTCQVETDYGKNAEQNIRFQVQSLRFSDLFGGGSTTPHPPAGGAAAPKIGFRA